MIPDRDVLVKKQVPPVDHRRLAPPVREAASLLLDEIETDVYPNSSSIIMTSPGQLSGKGGGTFSKP